MKVIFPALDKTATFKIKQISAEGEFATIKTTRQTGGYDVRSFKLHLVPAPAIPELKVGMSVLFKLKEEPIMWTGIWRELRYLLREKWDLCLVTLAPALVIILFSSMFAQGKPGHLPICDY